MHCCQIITYKGEKMITLRVNGVKENEIKNLEQLPINLILVEDELTITFDEQKVDMISLLGVLKRELGVEYENINQVV